MSDLRLRSYSPTERPTALNNYRFLSSNRRDFSARGEMEPGSNMSGKCEESKCDGPAIVWWGTTTDMWRDDNELSVIFPSFPPCGIVKFRFGLF